MSILFAAFLGYNPVQHLVGPQVLGARCRRTTRRSLTGQTFFPHLISGPFRDGLHAAFAFAIVACLVAAGGVAACAAASYGTPRPPSPRSIPRGAACALSGTASPPFA